MKSTPGATKRYLAGASDIVSPSLFLKSEFSSLGYHVQYIPNFLQLEEYSFKEREKFTPKLLWVRSFHHIYNPLLAINLINRLVDKYSSVKLWMVGPDKDGSRKDIEDEISNLNLSDNIELVGKLSKKDWIELSKQADLFINTTHFDNHPVSVIEAMALGIPVISTNVGGIPYLISDGENGLLVNDDSISEFVDKVEFLVTNPQEAQSIAINARKHIEQLDWKNVKSDWHQLLKKYAA